MQRRTGTDTRWSQSVEGHPRHRPGIEQWRPGEGTPSARKEATVPGALSRTIRVFIIDDHHMFTQAVAAALSEEADMEVVDTVDTVAEARRRLPALETDVILLDQRLPDGQGTHVAAELRALRPGARVVLVTAAAEPSILNEALAAGCGGAGRGVGSHRRLTGDAAAPDQPGEPERPRHRGADPARNRGASLPRRRAEQRGDQPAAVHQHPHPAQPHPEYHRQARRPLQAGGGLHRHPGRADHRPEPRALTDSGATAVRGGLTSAPTAYEAPNAARGALD